MQSSSDPTTHTPGISVAIYKIFKALARFSLRRGISVAAMSELLRRAYLSAAVEVIAEENEKITTARICAMTGLYRREVRRLEQLPPIGDHQTNDKLNRSSRVVEGWLNDPDFQTKTGRPAVLKSEGPNGFSDLVRRYSGDVTPNAIRQELERLGKLKISKGGSLKLQSSVYINQTDEIGLSFLGDDTAELINTITHNLDSDESARLFQRKVAYINIPEKHVGKFRQLAETESQRLLEKLDRWLSQLRATPEDKNQYRVGVGIYHFRSEQNEKVKNAKNQRKNTVELVQQYENFE